MRVTENSLTETYLYNQQQILKSKTKIQTQLATDSKIQTISDDVTGSLDSMKINSNLKKNDTYLANVEEVTQFMNTTLNAMDNMSSEIQKILNLAVSADNPFNSQNLTSMGESVKNSLSAIVQNLNVKYNDMPVFNGTNFKDSPVTLDVNGKAVLSAADFSGEIQAQVSQSVKQTLNISGSKITGTGLFTAINNIIDSLSSGTIPTAAQLKDLQDSYTSILNLQSVGGQTINRMDDLKQMLTNNQSNLRQMLADKQGIDAAALTTDLNYKDYLLQMTNKLLARNYPATLFDYL